MAGKGKPKEMCCVIFSSQLGSSENGTIRDKACLSAQRNANKVSDTIADLKNKIEVAVGQKDAYSRQIDQANEQTGRERKLAQQS